MANELRQFFNAFSIITLIMEFLVHFSITQ